MHICLDFAPELLRQADLDKQAFAVDLVSHLSVQYALPKSYSTARLAVNVLSTMLSGELMAFSRLNTLCTPLHTSQKEESFLREKNAIDLRYFCNF